ncbi:MAG: hypothetical protein R3Y49_02975 [Rikenellaceae bacterium]
MNTEKTTSIEQSPNRTQSSSLELLRCEELKAKGQFSAVTATLGFADGAEVKDVMARLNTLISTEAKLKETEKSLADTKIVLAGKDATITNLQKDLGSATVALSTYQAKEQQERTERITTMIEAAVTAGKITAGTKAGWVKMAEDNIELVEQTLVGIPERTIVLGSIHNRYGLKPLDGGL